MLLMNDEVTPIPVFSLDSPPVQPATGEQKQEGCSSAGDDAKRHTSYAGKNFLKNDIVILDILRNAQRLIKMIPNKNSKTIIVQTVDNEPSTWETLNKI